MGCRKSDTPNGYTFQVFGNTGKSLTTHSRLSAETHVYFVGETGAIAVHRVDMLNALSSRLTADTVPSGFFTPHFKKRLMNYTQDPSGVTLHFEDGTSAQADILIGADGIGSHTRKTMYSENSERARANDPGHADYLMTHALPIWTGIYIYRFLVDSIKLQAVKHDHIALSRGISVSKHAPFVIRNLPFYLVVWKRECKYTPHCLRKRILIHVW